MAGVLLSGWEGLAAACCRSLLLPVARTPLVRTPLRAADVVTSAGARLVERAMPQIKDKEQVRSESGHHDQRTHCCYKSRSLPPLTVRQLGIESAVCCELWFPQTLAESSSALGCRFKLNSLPTVQAHQPLFA